MRTHELRRVPNDMVAIGGWRPAELAESGQRSARAAGDVRWQHRLDRADAARIRFTRIVDDRPHLELAARREQQLRPPALPVDTVSGLAGRIVVDGAVAMRVETGDAESQKIGHDR